MRRNVALLGYVFEMARSESGGGDVTEGEALFMITVPRMATEGASDGAFRLLAQLCGLAPCEVCDYRRQGCLCGRYPNPCIELGED